jgi:hypothetical protein
MMEDDSSRSDIRHLLKNFGVKADEAIVSHLARLPGTRPLRLRLVLEDLTDYGDAPPERPLAIEVIGQVRGNPGS